MVTDLFLPPVSSQIGIDQPKAFQTKTRNSVFVGNKGVGWVGVGVQNYILHISANQFQPNVDAQTILNSFLKWLISHENLTLLKILAICSLLISLRLLFHISHPTRSQGLIMVVVGKVKKIIGVDC